MPFVCRTTKKRPNRQPQAIGYRKTEENQCGILAPTTVFLQQKEIREALKYNIVRTARQSHRHSFFPICFPEQFIVVRSSVACSDEK